MTNNNGGPAFPVAGSEHNYPIEGMTLRDYFAAKAMQKLDHDADKYWLATRAYEIADAMLEAREK